MVEQLSLIGKPKLLVFVPDRWLVTVLPLITMLPRPFDTVLVRRTVIPYVLPGVMITLGIIGGFFAAIVAGDSERGAIAMSVSVVGFLAWGIIALLFVMSDRTVIFNTTKRQVEVFRHRFGTTPIAAYPASQFQSVRLSKVRIRAILLTRAELMTKDAPLRLIDHSNEATVRAVAAVATQALRVPLIDVTKDAK